MWPENLWPTRISHVKNSWDKIHWDFEIETLDTNLESELFLVPTLIEAKIQIQISKLIILGNISLFHVVRDEKFGIKIVMIIDFSQLKT